MNVMVVPNAVKLLWWLKNGFQNLPQTFTFWDKIYELKRPISGWEKG